MQPLQTGVNSNDYGFSKEEICVSMKKTIDALRENKIDAKVFVGGAVLTKEYANDLGADYYSKDAKSAVEIAKMNFL